MQKIAFWKITLIATATLAAIFLFANSSFFSAKKISFEKQLKPILNMHRLKCCGGVKHRGGFSLITREEAFAMLKAVKHPMCQVIWPFI